MPWSAYLKGSTARISACFDIFDFGSERARAILSNFADFTDIGQLRAMDGKTLDGQTLTVSKAGQQPWRVTLRQGLQLVTVVSTDTWGSKVRLKWCFLMFSHDFYGAVRPKPTYRPQADPNENFKKAFGIPWHTI